MSTTMENTQISREFKDIEDQKVALMRSAKAQADAAASNAAQGRYLNPDYRVAGLEYDQTNALALGRQGIGAYQPFINAAGQTVGMGVNTAQDATSMLRGADTRNQFGAAQASLNQAAVPIGQLANAANTAGSGIGLIGQGAQGIMGAQNMANQSAQGYTPGAAQQFMNPYQQQVIDESIRQINRQGDISRQDLQAQAVKSGAFGGSREGIQRAELERGLSAQKNAAIVGGLSQGYNQAATQAQQAFEQQQGRQLQAAGMQGNLAGQLAGLSGMYGSVGSQQANIFGQQGQQLQSLGQNIGNLAGQQFDIGNKMAQGLGSLSAQQGNLGMQQSQLGQQKQAMGQQDTNFLYNLGSTQQKQQQAVNDANRQNELQRNMQPYQQMGFVSDIYRGAPTSQMQMSQQSQAAPSPFQQIAGLGIAGISAAAAGSRAGIF